MVFCLHKRHFKITDVQSSDFFIENCKTFGFFLKIFVGLCVSRLDRIHFVEVSVSDKPQDVDLWDVTFSDSKALHYRLVWILCLTLNVSFDYVDLLQLLPRLEQSEKLRCVIVLFFGNGHSDSRGMNRIGVFELNQIHPLQVDVKVPHYAVKEALE